jgi:hypothetical protein
MTEVELTSKTCFLYVYIKMSYWKISNICVSLIAHLHRQCFEVNYLSSLICKCLILFSGCKVIYLQFYACVLSHIFVSPSQLHHLCAANRWLIRWKILLCLKPLILCTWSSYNVHSNSANQRIACLYGNWKFTWRFLSSGKSCCDVW